MIVHKLVHKYVRKQLVAVAILVNWVTLTMKKDKFYNRECFKKKARKLTEQASK